MKLIMTTILLLSTQISFANCLGEAQFIGTVARAEKISNHQCHVTMASMQRYNESMVCPLDQTEVYASGIIVKVQKDTDCSSIEVGSEISGILVKNTDGSIELD